MYIMEYAYENVAVTLLGASPGAVPPILYTTYMDTKSSSSILDLVHKVQLSVSVCIVIWSKSLCLSETVYATVF